MSLIPIRKRPIGLAILALLSTGCVEPRPPLSEVETFYFRNQEKFAAVQQLACGLQQKYDIGFVFFRLNQIQHKLSQLTDGERDKLIASIQALKLNDLRIERTQQGCLLSLTYWDNWWGSSGQIYDFTFKTNVQVQFDPKRHNLTQIDWSQSQQSFEFSKPLSDNWSIDFLHAP
ncbi:hypothetical protein [Pseudoalteromonas sp. OOF1S-7]|uniref:hypothetical protein n=1 Tax=Pseudoalteromonas sp. OOF1S-7 TaxID=2917757 RepID=UPI001EF552FE|nr:hypothetical protein [Pseudoalteromonas sp. OOF1S-7]MCG7537195.1 hypothetical protein [Pseudoalteromonas sp. OOF1S-7]